MDLCTGRVRESLLFDLEKPDVYDFYPQKLLPETWEMLSQMGFAAIERQDDEVTRASTRALFGYYMMSVVVVCCAHSKTRLVTDESDPYRALARTLVDKNLEGNHGAERWHERFVALTLGAPDLSGTPLSGLVTLRQQEDGLMQTLRHNYVASLDSTVADIKAMRITLSPFKTSSASLRTRWRKT